MSYVNSKYLLKLRHKSKIAYVSCTSALGYGIFFFCYYIEDKTLGFIVSIIATLIIGVNT